MRNLIPYIGNCFDIFQAAVNRKDPSVGKQLLLNIAATLQARYTEYEHLFTANQLETLAKDITYTPIRTALLSLYDYNNKAVRDIRQAIESLQPQTIRYTCQYCSLESVESMDHVVSQTEFPEFVIHPLNLIPSCSKCNGHKSQYWRTDITRSILNMYRDTLPNIQYLFVDIGVDTSGILSLQYRLQNPGTVPNNLWNLIENHFTRLNLLIRMQQRASTELTELQSIVRAYFRNGITQIQAADILRETAADNRRNYGTNYWKSCLQDSLEKSPDFWASI